MSGMETVFSGRLYPRDSVWMLVGAHGAPQSCSALASPEETYFLQDQRKGSGGRKASPSFLQYRNGAAPTPTWKTLTEGFTLA